MSKNKSLGKQPKNHACIYCKKTFGSVVAVQRHYASKHKKTSVGVAARQRESARQEVGNASKLSGR